jgi:hypothetical protein
MTSDKDKILDRIRGLLALADRPEGNEAEAAAAAAKAGALLQKYNLDAAEVVGNGNSAEMVDITAESIHSSCPIWMFTLASAVCRSTMTKTYYRTERRPAKLVKNGKTHAWYTVFHFYGRRTNAEVAAYMFDQLVVWCEKTSLRRAREYAKDPAHYHASKSAIRGYRASWFTGAVIAIHQKLQEMNKTAAPAVMAIVLVRDQEVDDAWKDFSNRMRSVHHKPTHVYSSLGYTDGIADGHNVEIHAGLKGQG